MRSTVIPILIVVVVTLPSVAVSSDEAFDAEQQEAARVAANPPVPTEPGLPAFLLRSLRASEIIYFSEFEEDDGGLTATGDWQWGEYAWTGSSDPLVCAGATSPPPAPFSNSRMWGTVLNSCYSPLGNNGFFASCDSDGFEDDSVLTLFVDLTGTDTAYLSWAEWYDVFGNWDWVEVRVNGFQVHTVCDRPYAPPASWGLQTVDISDYTGSVVMIDFRFMASLTTQLSGWYIDNITVTTVPIDPIFYDTFSSGDTSNWSATVP
jgi:hypothetical protein